MSFKQSITHIRAFSSDFWIVIFAIFLNQTCNMALVFLVLYLTQHLHFSLSHASLGFALFCGSAVLSGIAFSQSIDRFGAIRLMVLLLLINGTLLMTFPLLHHFVFIMLQCMAWGATYGLYRSAAQAAIAHFSSAGMHKITFSLYRLVLNLGMSIGPALGGYLALHSYNAIFLVNGLGNLVACSTLFLCLRHSAYFNLRTKKATQSHYNYHILSTDRALCYFLLSIMFISMIFFQHEVALPVFLKENLNLPVSFYGLIFTINTLIIVCTELPLNILTLSWPYRLNFTVGSLILTLGFMGMAFTSTRIGLILLAVLWTIGEMMIYPAASSYIADIAPKEQRGNYIALYNTASNLGMFIGPWAGAILMDHAGAYALWLSCGLFGFFVILFIQQIKEPAEEKTLTLEDAQ